ncbi:MAG: phosphate uptake regulator PhoU [Bacteroidales bacterium]|nr:phosphate uptake regulator PhoU [Bacteroidales bacterium]
MHNKDAAINDILDSFTKYSNLVLAQLDILEKIVQDNDLKVTDELLDEINKNEIELDDYEVKISEKIIHTIVLHHPVASELRKIIACYRIIINIERIGDLVINIVDYIKNLKDPKVLKALSGVLFNMVVTSTSMVQKSLMSFLNNDKEYAIWTIKNDDVIDQMNEKLLKKGVSSANLPDELQEQLLNLITFKSIISGIERIADHAAHIAEASIYSLEGEDIRHKKETL